MSGTVLVALAEAMAIGIRSGVDKKVLAEVIRNSSGNSWMGENLMPVPGIVPTAPSSNGYKPSFRHELMIKDLTLGIDAAKKVGIESTMGNTAVEHAKRAAQDPRIKVRHISIDAETIHSQPVGFGLYIDLYSNHGRQEYGVELSYTSRIIIDPITVHSLFIAISVLGLSSGYVCVYFGLTLNQPESPLCLEANDFNSRSIVSNTS